MIAFICSLYDNDSHYHIGNELMGIYFQAAILGFCLITFILVI